MNLSIIKIFIKSQDNQLRDVLLNLIDEKMINSEIQVYVGGNIEELEKIKPDFVVLECIDINKSVKDLEYLKSEKGYSNDRIAISIDMEERFLLKYLVDKGIREFVYRPYLKEAVYIRFKNCINYIIALNNSKNKEIQFNALLNNTPYMAWFKDIDSNYIMVNDDFKEHCGKDMDLIYGRDDKFVWDGNIGEKCREYDLYVMKQKEQVVFNEIIPGRKGYREFNIHKSPVTDRAGEVIGTIGVARDITEIKNKENQFRMIIENIPFIVILTDINNIVLEASSNIENIVGIKREEIIGTSGKQFIGNELPNDFFDNDSYENNKVIEEGKCLEFERIINWKNQEYILKVYKAPIFDIEGKVSSIVTLIKNITEERRTQKKIEKLAFTDTLTGICNRRALYKCLENNICSKLDLVLGFIDLDNFKKLNDSYGHNYGDEVLIRFAEKLVKVCDKCTVARVGGDEFVIVWNEEVNKEELKKKLDNILSAINDVFTEYDKSKLLSASIGVVVEKAEGNTIESLMAKGDFALYRAKNQGKNRYVFYTDEMKMENMYNIQLERDLKNALQNNEILLNYQPQYAYDKKLKGFEALLRWNNKKYLDISIYNIVQKIEEFNLMDSIGERILEKAFLFSSRINKEREDLLTISINISQLQIMNERFVYRVNELINKTNVIPQSIIFEITETVLFDDIDIGISIERLHEIRRLGISIALDDFGTGYSSLNYLAELPISELKIDRSFVVGMRSSEKYFGLIKHITDISHMLKLEVVAEGVESQKELEQLSDIGIDYIQGYLYGKPQLEEEAVKLLEN